MSTALANAALVLSSKKNFQDGGQRRIINPKRFGSAFSLCRSAGIDGTLVKADFFSERAPPIENKIKQKKSNTKVASG